VLCQLSYSPGLNGQCTEPAATFRPVRAPTQQRALGTLFFVLGLAFGGIAFGAAVAGSGGASRYVIVVASGAIGLWLLGLALRGFRTR
jgi:hypothetical protein